MFGIEFIVVVMICSYDSNEIYMSKLIFVTELNINLVFVSRLSLPGNGGTN